MNACLDDFNHNELVYFLFNGRLCHIVTDNSVDVCHFNFDIHQSE